MFDNLSGKLNSVFKRLRGLGRLSEGDVSNGLKHVKMALLEADVNYRVTKKFIEDVRVRSLGQEVMSSLTPGQQLIKIVNEEMTQIMGDSHQDLNFDGPSPVFIMLVGLQGSGKTTTVAKLAHYLANKGKKPYLSSVDIYRPAAIEQLKVHAGILNIPIFDSEVGMNPVEICLESRILAAKAGCDIVLLDTAGRLHLDEKMMMELVDIKLAVKPSDILLVVDAMTGQEAVNVAKSFDEMLSIGGVVLSKVDGDARGGAALSMKFVTGKPIKFMGVGEKVSDLELFYPERMASRILGMGDLLTIIDKAKMALSKEKSIELKKKLSKNRFTLEDFKDQILQVRKMGSFGEILKMIPGFGKMKHTKNLNVDDAEFIRIEAIINSMTLQEREHYSIINGSRRRRIAKGSGTKVQDVNRLIKNYAQMIKVMKKFNKKGLRSLDRGILPF